MAPEQATGHDVDGRADIHALGVILYEMLIGDVPFNAASTPAVLMMHVNDAPEPPSRRRPDLPIPPALEAVALRCLEKDPAQRFQTAEEFSDALERAVPAGAPLTSRSRRTPRPPSCSLRFRRTRRPLFRCTARPLSLLRRLSPARRQEHGPPSRPRTPQCCVHAFRLPPVGATDD